jgi:hypothetical protein
VLVIVTTRDHASLFVPRRSFPPARIHPHLVAGFARPIRSIARETE